MSLQVNGEVPVVAPDALLNTVVVSGGGAEQSTALTHTSVKAAGEPIPYGVSLVSDIVNASGAFSAACRA